MVVYKEIESAVIHAGIYGDKYTRAVNVPIYQTSTFEQTGIQENPQWEYARSGNPTRAALEALISDLEKGYKGFAFASGMAAIAAVLTLFKSGDTILVSNNVYGGTFRILDKVFKNFDLNYVLVDTSSVDNIKENITDKVKAVYIETPTNPLMNITDIKAVSELAKAHGLLTIVDNTFMTPYLQRPIELGADIVVHSATKFIGGHGTAIGGVIIDSGNFDWTKSDKYPWLTEPNVSYHGVSFAKDCAPAAFVTYIRAILLRDTGATISPVHSFVFLQGLETLSLRVERHVENALKVVEYLNNHPLVEKVNHPSVSKDKVQQELYAKYFPNGGGSIFTFEIKGDAKKAQEFIDQLELFSLLANVADVKSLAIHPASTTHSECNEAELLDQGIKPNTIRLSIGTENINDIIEDLDEAFKALS